MFSKKERILLFTLAAVQFNHIVDFMIVMPLGPQLMRSFSIDPHQFGLLVSSYTFTAGIASFFAALMIDKFDRKTALMFFLSGFTIGTLSCAFANSYGLLLLARAATGGFGGVLGSIVLAIAGDQFDQSRRGSAMGVVMAAFSAASVLGVPFSLYLANHYDWHAPFIFLGLLAMVFSLVIYFILPSMTNHLKGPHANQNPFEPLLHVLRSRQQLLGLLFLALLIFGQFSIIPYLSQSLVANAGMTEAQLPLIYLVGGAASILSSPLVGRLSDKFGKLQVFTIFVLLSFIPVFIITNLNTQPLYILLILCGGFFVISGGRNVPAMAMVTGLVSPAHRGSYMSVVSSVQQLAASIASLAAGMIVVKDSAGHFLNYNVVGYISIGFAFVAMLLARSLKPTN